ELFRRDQVWFVEKDNAGASVLYPLLEFSPRKGEALAKGYLRGRYGAIPFIGSLEGFDSNGKA
ncbi:MAG: ATP-binding protein, partial [Chloroflexi bacterium]